MLYFDDEQDYALEALSLFMSCVKHQSDKFNEESLGLLADAMSDTSMKDSLKYVCIFEDEYPVEEVQKIFDDKGFDVLVSNQPIYTLQ